MDVVTRKQWGAKPPKAITPLPPERVRHLIVHYSGMNSDEQDDHRNCAGRMRGIQRFHMESDQLTPGGASDIAYNWLVCRHGAIFKGRGWRRRSAATGPANDHSVAVCFLGNDSQGRKDATPQARRAIREVLAFCQRNAPNFQAVRGHRDFMATACPGDELYAFVQELNAELA